MECAIVSAGGEAAPLLPPWLMSGHRARGYYGWLQLADFDAASFGFVKDYMSDKDAESAKV